MTIRLFNHNMHMPVVVLIFFEFLAVVLSAIVAGIISTNLLQLRGLANPPVTVGSAGVVGVLLLASLAAMGLYRVGLRASLAGVAARVLVGVAIAVFLVSFTYYVIPIAHIDPRVLGIAAALASVLICVGRIIFHLLVDEDMFKRRVVIFGAGEQAEVFLKLRRRADQRGFNLISYIATENDQPNQIDAANIIGMPDDLCKFAIERSVDEIVIAVDDRRGVLPMRDLLECRVRGIDIIDAMSFLERETGKVDLSIVNPSWLIFSNGFRRKLGRRVNQRVFDVVASLVAMVFAAPVMAFTALAIFIEDRGPILYRQRRVGRGNEDFNVLKFRSMRADAEQDGEAVWAQENDERITKVGRIIRRLRFDELPQLINVLRGQMSIVGPRPERPEFVESLSENIPYYMERHRVRPGITGWAQLCYPYGSSEKDALEKLQYDLYYVKNRTLLFDIMIVLQTVEVVLWQKGAR